MIPESIKVGDVVKLKSGSPMMTVQYVDQKTNSVKVAWFDVNEACTAVFHTDTLHITLKAV